LFKSITNKEDLFKILEIFDEKVESKYRIEYLTKELLKFSKINGLSILKNILIYYLTNITEPVVSFELYQFFLEIDNEKEEFKIEKIKICISKLSKIRTSILFYLCLFFSTLVSKANIKEEFLGKS
jgi:hypothetical protein